MTDKQKFIAAMKKAGFPFEKTRLRFPFQGRGESMEAFFATNEAEEKRLYVVFDKDTGRKIGHEVRHIDDRW